MKTAALLLAFLVTGCAGEVQDRPCDLEFPSISDSDAASYTVPVFPAGGDAGYVETCTRIGDLGNGSSMFSCRPPPDHCTVATN
jgi:hypothetical protein